MPTMPIPDAVLPAEPETEAEAEHRKRREIVYVAANALLGKQLACGKACATCEGKCDELQKWLDVGE
jgi:hypothetical protein